MNAMKQKAFKYCFLFLFVLISIFIYLFQAYDFLNFTRKNKAEILVVEGWLPDAVLNKAREEFLQNRYSMVITTGFPYREGVLIGSDGRVEFPVDQKIDPPADSLYTIGLWIRGTKSMGHFPHIIMYADSTRLGAFFTSRKKKEYSFTLKLEKPPEFIRVDFDNDAFTKYTDRNLFYYAATVNGHTFPANSQSVGYYRRENGKYILHNRLSHGTATSASSFLVKAGIPDSLVIAVETRHKIKSKTYTSALDVRTWLEKNKPGRHALTIFTEATHAHRSYLSFQKAFGITADLGMITFVDRNMNRSNWWKSLRGWRTILYETTGILYISVFV
jgi:hypothetical protein